MNLIKYATEGTTYERTMNVLREMRKRIDDRLGEPLPSIPKKMTDKYVRRRDYTKKKKQEKRKTAVQNVRKQYVQYIPT